MSAPAGNPSPDLFFATASAYQRTEALRAALEFDLFTAIGEGRGSAAALAAHCSASEKGMRILCDYLAFVGFLSKQGARYALTPDSAAFLDRRSPAYMGGTLEFMHNDTLRDGFAHIAAAVRKGGTVQSPGGLTDPEHPEWIRFARAMAPMMVVPAQLAARLIDRPLDARLAVLDIAAGHGLYGIEVARRFAHAQICGLDWPGVLLVAQENAKQAGLAERYRVIAGSAFEVPLGGPYDVVLIPNFLHHFGMEACTGFLRRVYQALAPDGLALTVEFVPDEDRLSPPFPATFALAMLVATAEGDAYTFAELDRMFRAAGFTRNTLQALEPGPQQAVLSYK